MNANPTTRTYQALCAAYDHFNAELFGRKLPACLVTLQRTKKAYGYFARDRFGTPDGTESVDEIALNPSHFANRKPEETLSTLVHEMVHLWQHRFGKISRAGYHNKQWAAKMRDVGLMPSSTGAPGGKETGQRVSHYIAAGGAYERAFKKLEAKGLDPLYIELWTDEAKARKKAESKTKYTCGGCDLNAWGKPDIRIICADCDELMMPAE